MKCAKVHYLISLSQDGMLSEREERRLRAHLAQCESCRVLAVKMSTISAGVEADARDLAARASISAEFSSRLRCALAEENAARLGRPAALIERVIDRVLTKRAPIQLRAARSLAALVALLGAVAYTASVIATPPPSAAGCSLGHIASFDVRVSPDGRVYAALMDRNVPGPGSRKEVYLR